MREQTLSLEAHGRRPGVQRVPRHHAAPRGRSPWSTTRPRRCSSAASTSPTAGRRRCRPRRSTGRARSGGTSGGGTWPTQPGDPVVIDWRAEVSTAFYRASAARRRWACGCAAGSASTAARSPRTRTSTSTDPGEATGAQPDPRRARSSARASGPMRDIVATIQPEQDVIVRADVADHGLRAGAPGHRQDRGRAAPGGVAALRVPRPAGPRRRPRHRPEPRLPRPHRRGAARPRRGRGPPRDGRGAARRRCRSAASTASEAAVLKGDARLAEVLRPGRVVPRPRRPPSPWSLPRGAHKWRVPAYEVAEIVEELRTRGVRYEAARQMLPQRLAHAVLLRMERGRRLPRRPGAGRRRPRSAVVAPVRRRRCGRRSTRARCCSSCSATPTPWPAHADGLLDDGRAAAPALADAAEEPRRRPVVGRRRGAARRDPRPPRAHAQPRPRGPRRGAGPLADAAARGRPALLDRLGDGARRHRPGHDAVGDRLVGVVAAPPRQARRAHRGARPRVPGAGHGDRLRRPAAAVHGARPRRPGVGPREPGPARHRAGRRPAACSTGWLSSCTTARCARARSA